VRRLVILVLLLALSGCSAEDFTNPFGWFSGHEKPHLKGERIPVLLDERQVRPDPDIQDVEVSLPKPWLNPDWPQAGGNPAHAMQNLQLGDNLKRIWDVSIGSGKSQEWKHLAAPVIGGGRIYTMDTDAIVTAFDSKGSELWETDVKPEDVGGKGDLGGGLAYADGRVYVTSNYGEVLALDAKSGKILWRRALSAPTRAAPTVAGDHVYVVTSDNQLFALSSKDGNVLWTHAGLSEITGLVGAASPAYDGGIVVVPYTSGEIYALRGDNGRPVWSDTLAAIRRVDQVSALADIRGNPVMDRDRVVAISHSGRMVSIDLRSGGRAWEDSIGGITQPWVAGNFIYVMSTDNKLICLSREDGRVRWLTQLDRWGKPDKKEDIILWTGPILAGDKLVVGGTNGELLIVSPLTGQVTDTVDIGTPISVQPIVANGTLYVLTDDGTLLAYH